MMIAWSSLGFMFLQKLDFYPEMINTNIVSRFQETMQRKLKWHFVALLDIN